LFLAPINTAYTTHRQSSKPDDIAINLLISHISGKGPRVYPQVVSKPGEVPMVTRRKLFGVKPEASSSGHFNLKQPKASSSGHFNFKSTKAKRPHRRVRPKPARHFKASFNDRFKNDSSSEPLEETEYEPTGFDWPAVLHLGQSFDGRRVEGGRRRLGMSGAAVWPIWRGDGALWLAYFFGGLPRVSDESLLRRAPKGE
jgi:hypothetical protein